MPLINCEINIFLTWSEECIIITENYGNGNPKFELTGRTLCSSYDFISSK